MMIQLSSPVFTERLGYCVARCIHPPSSVWLRGQLGAGKTTFCRGFIHAFKSNIRVKSPTYTLLESYATENLTIHHFDFYRLTQSDELEYIGIREYFSDDSVCLIEWPENIGPKMLPPPQLEIILKYASVEEVRYATLRAIDKQLSENIQREYLK